MIEPVGLECPPPELIEGTCLGDYDCEGDKKCCSIDGCGLTCSPPKPPPTEVTIIKGERGEAGVPGDAVSLLSPVFLLILVLNSSKIVKSNMNDRLFIKSSQERKGLEKKMKN